VNTYEGVILQMFHPLLVMSEKLRSTVKRRKVLMTVGGGLGAALACCTGRGQNNSGSREPNRVTGDPLQEMESPTNHSSRPIRTKSMAIRYVRLLKIPTNGLTRIRSISHTFRLRIHRLLKKLFSRSSRELNQRREKMSNISVDRPTLPSLRRCGVADFTSVASVPRHPYSP
jgi:hypothetical protein